MAPAAGGCRVGIVEITESPCELACVGDFPLPLPPKFRTTRAAHRTPQRKVLHVNYWVKLSCSGFRTHPESGEDTKGGRVYSNLHASTSSRTDVQETSPPRQRFSRHSSTDRLETVRSGIPGFLEESSKLHSRGRSSGGQRASLNGELHAMGRYLVQSCLMIMWHRLRVIMV